MRTLLTLLALGAGFYLLLALLLFAMQERVVFLPDLPGRELDMTPDMFGFDYFDVSLQTVDRIALHGWYVRASQPRGVVLFLHGNAGNISHRLDSIAIFHQLGLDTLIIDYRGYGQSEGKAGEKGIYLDGDAAWRYLVDERAEDPARILVFGRSLGGAVAARLAADHEPAGLIVESCFTSARDMAAALYPLMPVRLLMRLRFPVIDYVSRANSPVMIVHSRDDEIIPFAMGRALYDTAPEPKAFLELEGDHNGGFLRDRDYYLGGLDKFITEHL